MVWTIGAMLVGVAIGFAAGWWLIRRARRPLGLETLVQWTEPPVSAWREDWRAALLITLHGAGILLLALLFLLDNLRNPDHHTLFLIDATPFMSAREQQEFNSQLFTLATWGLGIAGVLSGSVVAYHLATRGIGPLTIGITEEGVVRGRYYIAWSAYSHFVADAQSRLIRFFTNRLPEVASMAWRPPTPELYHQAVALLQEHLPSSPPRKPIPWSRRLIVFAGLVLVPALLFVALGTFLFVQGFGWAWLYYTFGTYLAFSLGLLVFRN